MYNLHKELCAFYAKRVRLGKDLRDDLAASRDLCMKRLANGLGQLGHPLWQTYINQGGYIMHTLNQAADNNYDIDIALIFREEDLPTSAYNARQRVRAGFVKTGDQFREAPSARTNAVTVWYATGEHLDFAIFRRRVDAWGNVVIEHASGDEWKARDPEAVTDWFETQVKTRSPGPSHGATVDAHQLRRIVRFVKFFTRARTGWMLPGGMITTALVCETYQYDLHRDDVALYRTLQALHYRLAMNLAVSHPTDGTNLTLKQKRSAEVSNLKLLLDDLMPKLAILEHHACSRAQARNAWRQFFNSDFWNAENDTGEKALLKTVAVSAPPVSFGTTPRVPVKDVGFG
jgi:hypothetical protein